MFGLGAPELMIVLFLAFILFGAKKLPELARATGESLKEFKKATREAMEEEQRPVAADSQRRMEVASTETHSVGTQG